MTSDPVAAVQPGAGRVPAGSMDAEGLSNMEVALARLVGAGLTLVFEGYEHQVPQKAVESGFELIRFVARHRPEIALALTQGVITDIWNEWRASKLPDALALTHVEALPHRATSIRRHASPPLS